MTAANIRRQRTRFLFLQNPDDLLIAEPAAFHSSGPLRNRLYRKMATSQGGTSQGLSEFLSDGRLEMDTNTVEREIRPVAVTRKAALFVSTPVEI